MHIELLSVFVSDQQNAAKLGGPSFAGTGSLVNTIQRLVPHLATQIRPLIHDLDVQGITNGVGSALNVTMTAHGAMELENRLTAFGHGFVRFIKS